MRFFIVGLAALVLCLGSASAQIDTEFWFAPPDVSASHGQSPVYLRLATLEKAAEVKIYQPARGTDAIRTVNIGASSSNTVDLSGILNWLETVNTTSVQNTGLYIQSSEPISAYYEISSLYNADIFALKGKNAEGNNFIIPSQNIWNNAEPGRYQPQPLSSFDIVATQNNTVVWITPSTSANGHKKGETFIVKLNKGQTYSVVNSSLSAVDHLGGSIVKSNKPISITLKEDSLNNGDCWDMIGDQLVPVKVAGKEYVVMQGQLETDEYLFVMAIYDSTRFSIHGSSESSYVLNRGQMRSHVINSSSTYIKANKPVYVTQVTGFGCELGMAVIPSINCRGSSQISFTRATSDFFGLNVLVRKDGIDYFTINGNANPLPGSSFKPVNGTNNEWYFATVEIGLGTVGSGQAGLIKNEKNSFQVGIINGDRQTSTKFGYFSAFSTLFIGDDIDICEGQSVELDAGPGKTKYTWSTGSTEQKITISEEGTYYVSAGKESCILSDTLVVTVKKASFDLGKDITICNDEMATIDAGENFSYKWGDGSTERQLITADSGMYKVEIRDYTGCVAEDSLKVHIKEGPNFDLGDNVIKCPKDTVAIDASFSGATYMWSNGSTDSIIQIVEDTIYWADVTWNECTIRDSIEVVNLPGPWQDTIIGTISVCPFVEGVEYSIAMGLKDQLQWFLEGGSRVSNSANQIVVDWGQANSNAYVVALVTDSMGCSGDTIKLPVTINEKLEPLTPTGADTVCVNNAAGQLYATNYTNGSVYEWFTKGQIVDGAATSEVELNWPGAGKYDIYVAEHSVTQAAVCDGTSSALKVLVYEDSARLSLLSVLVNNPAKGIEVYWNAENTNSMATPELEIFRRLMGETDWESVGKASNIKNIYLDTDVAIDSFVYQYKIEVTNNCGELLESSYHNNILLQGSSDEETDVIELHWNSYEGWSDGVDHYEVWRQLDGQEFELYKTLDNATNDLMGNLGLDGFQHRYFIKAISASGQVSISNEVKFKFEHPIFIPNVVTPNSDGKNDYFVIKKIEMYPNANLSISNRWGEPIYKSQHGYDNSFNASQLSTGVYFYHLDLGNGRDFKGPLYVIY